MTYDIELSKIAVKNLAKIPRKDLVRIQIKIDTLTIEPRPIDLKKIEGETNLYRIRCGKYRILYRIFEEKILVLIVNVDHRQSVYKNL